MSNITFYGIYMSNKTEVCRSFDILKMTLAITENWQEARASGGT